MLSHRTCIYQISERLLKNWFSIFMVKPFSSCHWIKCNLFQRNSQKSCFTSYLSILNSRMLSWHIKWTITCANLSYYTYKGCIYCHIGLEMICIRTHLCAWDKCYSLIYINTDNKKLQSYFITMDLPWISCNLKLFSEWIYYHFAHV